MSKASPSILVFDPGESTGWVFQKMDGSIVGGTCGKNHLQIEELFYRCAPDIVVFERFNLYPGMAKSLSWNTFYPCEVIGVIRFLCLTYSINYYEQAPSVKKYSGAVRTSPEYSSIRSRADNPKNVTEHTWDAYQHLKYYIRNKRR